MPTPKMLEEQGLLTSIEVELDPGQQPQRLIYAHPRVITWLDGVLPSLESDNYVPGALRPEEQTDVVFYMFISGATKFEMPPKCLKPNDDGIWELRSHDLRFFGWFWRRGVFIMTSIEITVKCKDIGLYHGHKEQAKHFRESLDLDQPKFTAGGTEHVL